MKTLHDQQYVCPKCKKKYSYSEWSEETPPKKLRCNVCDKSVKTFTVAFSPSWKKYEEGMHSDNKKLSIDSSEKFEMERAHAVKTDPKARSWEEGRKQSWQKDKPYYVKKVQEAGI
jgi:hypothetical protein